MKNNLRRLSRAVKMLGYVNFYSVSCTKCEINLQGRYNVKLIEVLKKAKFNVRLGNDNYITATRLNYVVTLTD